MTLPVIRPGPVAPIQEPGKDKVKFEFQKEDLPRVYESLKKDNPLFDRVERALKLRGVQGNELWTDEEIRTAQLYLAVFSNQDLKAANDQLKVAVSKLQFELTIARYRK